MSDIQIGVNLEFIRSSEKSFRVGIETAARLGILAGRLFRSPP